MKFEEMIPRLLVLVCAQGHFADVWDRTRVIALHSSVGPCPTSKPPGFTCLLSRSKHTFVKLFRDVSKVQFCFIVTVNPNHLMLISYNLLHCQLSSSLIFISQLNVHLFVDVFIKLDCNKSVCAYIYFPFVLKNSK